MDKVKLKITGLMVETSRDLTRLESQLKEIPEDTWEHVEIMMAIRVARTRILALTECLNIVNQYLDGDL